MTKKWMQKVSKEMKKGALHKELNVPASKKIPAGKMEKAEAKAKKGLKSSKASPSTKTKDRKTIKRITLAKNFANARKK